MSNKEELKAQRAALAANTAEAKIAALDARIAAAEAEEQAEQDREHARLVAEARAEVTAAMVPVRHEAERLHEAFQVLDVAIAKVLSLGEHDTGARVNAELRAAVRAQIASWVAREDADREAAVPDSEKRRKFLEGRLVFEQELLDGARKAHRDEDAYRLEKSIAAIRTELDMPTPLGERVRQIVNPTRVRAEIEDQTSQAHYAYWMGESKKAREAEAKKAADDAPTQR